jgi:predicted Zn-dependent protease
MILETHSNRGLVMKHLLPGILWFALLVSSIENLRAHDDVADHLRLLDQAIERTPNKQSLYIERGALYSSEAGMHERALQDFRRAEQLGPPVAVAYQLGMLFFRTGDFAKARSYFDRYLEQFPGFAPAYEYRAKAAYRMGDKAKSMADYDAFFRLQKHINPGSYIDAAGIHASSNEERDIEAALSLLDQGMNRLGLNPELQRYAIRLELQRSQPDKAIQRLLGLKTLLKESPAWQVDMAELLIETGRSAQAAAYLDAAEARLAKLRSTPARSDLAKKIRTLKRQPDPR